MARARALFADRDDVCIPYLGRCANKRLLFMEYIDDQDLEERLQLSLTMKPRRALRHSMRACAAAGRWLREWHTLEKSCEPLGPLLQKYFDGHGEKPLRLLEPTIRRRLQSVIDSLGDETICARHGDFNPHNVLWSKRNGLTVLDFGHFEWRTSPWWDCITMEIGLLRILKFSLKSPGKWLPGFARAAVAAFWRSYGEPEGSLQARIACTALRHLVLYGYDITAGSAYRKRAEWHYQELQSVLKMS
jgi:tRNA A-37 threonylcarbamoyl transferase component Bud32